jgi:hypothetical protein
MSNQIEMYYSTFGGVDTRSSKLLQNPKTFRRGTKNFRYDFQDQTINRQGFQRKDSGAPNFVDIFEYKYRDPNAGASATQILGVATDGHLYRQRTHSLKFNTHTGYTSVSVYFDDVANTFKIALNGAIPVTVAISDTMTLKDNPTTTASLAGALNAISGVSVSIVDDAGATVAASTQLAYLLDCVINDSTFANNAVYFWEQILFPDSTSVPFKTTRDYNTSSDYEGISSANLNNVIYITDGGFPMKYDGKAVYRAGVPECVRLKQGNLTVALSPVNPISFGTVTTNTPLPVGSYGYKFRYVYKDINGASYYGIATNPGNSGLDTVSVSPFIGSGNAFPIALGSFDYGKDFPIFGCKVLSYNAGTKTITTDGAHNVVAGMCIVQPVWSNALSAKTSENLVYHYYAKVVSVTSNTIVLDSVDAAYSTFNNPFATQILAAAWVPENMHGKFESYLLDGTNPYGLFVEIFRTKVNQHLLGPYYLVGHSAVPLTSDYVAPFDFLFVDNMPDTNLTVNFVDLDPGEEIPRACKYLCVWQAQLVQAGRPVNNALANEFYPTIISLFDPTSILGAFPEYYLITEALLCDFQSIYHTDFTTPEGFPQDGEHEFAIDTPYADRVTGIAQNKDALFALKQRSTAVLTGSVAENDIIMEVLEADAGCSSHKSIQDVRGHLVWLDGINGFYSCVAGRLPENIGFPIQDYQKINELGLDYSKAAACNFRKESLYVCSVEGTTFVFDYADNGSLKRACWYIWDGFTGKSLLATSDNKFLLWDGTYTQKMKLTLTDYDHSDHKTAISMVLNTAWLTQGRPTIDKHYVGFWINSIQGDFTLSVKQYGNFLEDLIGTQTNVYFLPETSSKKFIKAQVKAALPKLSAISFGMEHNEINKAVKIQGYELQYSADFAAGEPKR